MNTDILKRFNALTIKKENLSRELKKTTEELKAVEKIVEEELLQAEVENIRIDGRTIYTTSRIFAKYGENNRDQVIDVLRGNEETRPLVQYGFNANALSAFVSERVKNEQPLPKNFEGVIDYTEVTYVRSKLS